VYYLVLLPLQVVSYLIFVLLLLFTADLKCRRSICGRRLPQYPFRLGWSRPWGVQVEEDAPSPPASHAPALKSATRDVEGDEEEEASDEDSGVGMRWGAGTRADAAASMSMARA